MTLTQMRPILAVARNVTSRGRLQAAEIAVAEKEKDPEEIQNKMNERD